VDALRQEALPVISLPPSASAIARGGQPAAMFVEPIERALQAGLLPLIQGDTVFDREQGATILSTEAVFAYLAPRLRPGLILLAGIEEGVYADYPERSHLMAELTPSTLAQAGLETSQAVDVTGGMAAKVAAALEISAALPQVQIRIFSGEKPGNLLRALRGDPLGTLIRRP
jgi:isopentenyl phosphate kinase